ncbi:hypothetical protein FUAX_05610 [Fulvitalea axinellae]|uniref:Mannosylglycerate hydrolase MGH1-like glycoside hydrolase domain-containing protein n=1 Tax=Fulvitalea axinellae TaxID=1182444 RepID=A0AAU9C824_9BACT|nr:hypothetical protein FUAX_05610 [Fulvitalea axinellae]
MIRPLLATGLAIVLALGFLSCEPKSIQTTPGTNPGGSWKQLKSEANSIGKKEWRPMLSYVAELHKKSTHPPVWPFEHEWEEIGPGYVYGPAFGHWDLVHQVIDLMPAYPEHAYKQLLNNVKNQEDHGMVPGSFWMPGSKLNKKRTKASWSREKQGHPPFWVFAIDDYVELTGADSVLKRFYGPLVRQISWFENNRKAEGEGFYYTDILTKRWESGVDEGIRFDDTAEGAWACIDATSHVYYLYKVAAKWSNMLGMDDNFYGRRADQLEKHIQEGMYDKKDGLFYDSWAMKDEKLRTLAFETLFPIVAGAATKPQADRLINEYLLDTTCFNTAHPIATVGKRDPKFELRMWRGPAWNSMTYWVARGCVKYGRKDAAKIILEKALDSSAKQFEKTGTIWEFYHPLGGNPEEVLRKPGSARNKPCKDYLGHNPVIAMARLYAEISK